MQATKHKIVGGTKQQKEDYLFFLEHRPQYLMDRKLVGKVLVIANKEVQGHYDTYAAAIQAALASFRPGGFIVQQVVDEGEVVNILSSAR